MRIIILTLLFLGSSMGVTTAMAACSNPDVPDATCIDAPGSSNIEETHNKLFFDWSNPDINATDDQGQYAAGGATVQVSSGSVVGNRNPARLPTGLVDNPMDYTPSQNINVLGTPEKYRITQLQGVKMKFLQCLGKQKDENPDATCQPVPP